VATEKHPYTSGTGHIGATITQLRKAFPPVVNADILKKFEIAPNNETYILNILKFLKIIDPEGKKSTTVAPLFHKSDDEFSPGFAKLVHDAYSDLFNTYGEDAWDTPQSKLVAYFRTHDDTTELVGIRQANTFRVLARLSGKVTASPESVVKPKSPTKAKPVTKKSQPAHAAAPAPAPSPHAPTPPINSNSGQPSAGMALTVRVEINLPAGADQETYDAIFKSIRENLMNGHVS
jgi:hypothetical protein